ncbi:MAG: SMR family transporter [Arsenophonus sp.]
MVGVLYLISVLCSFSALDVADNCIELYIAYAILRTFGIGSTVAACWILFN